VSPETFSFGRNFDQQANLIFRSLMQRACHPPENRKNRFILLIPHRRLRRFLNSLNRTAQQPAKKCDFSCTVSRP
jgi:hypothetical protein